MRYKVCFNRGTLDWSKAWVIDEYRNDGELSGLQHVVAGIKLNGATAETATAPEGCPPGYLIVTGQLILSDTGAEFVV
jgi:hypothetical protein